MATSKSYDLAAEQLVEVEVWYVHAQETARVSLGWVGTTADVVPIPPGNLRFPLNVATIAPARTAVVALEADTPTEIIEEQQIRSEGLTASVVNRYRIQTRDRFGNLRYGRTTKQLAGYIEGDLISKVEYQY